MIITKWLSGKKANICGIAGLVLGALMAIPGIDVPDWVLVVVGSLGGLALRAGVKKGQHAADDVMDVLKAKK